MLIEQGATIACNKHPNHKGDSKNSITVTEVSFPLPEIEDTTKTVTNRQVRAIVWYICYSSLKVHKNDNFFGSDFEL
jgi:hypothetical protein